MHHSAWSSSASHVLDSPQSSCAYFSKLEITFAVEGGKRCERDERYERSGSITWQVSCGTRTRDIKENLSDYQMIENRREVDKANYCTKDMKSVQYSKYRIR